LGFGRSLPLSTIFTARHIQSFELPPEKQNSLMSAIEAPTGVVPLTRYTAAPPSTLATSIDARVKAIVLARVLVQKLCFMGWWPPLPRGGSPGDRGCRSGSCQKALCRAGSATLVSPRLRLPHLRRRGGNRPADRAG